MPLDTSSIVPATFFAFVKFSALTEQSNSACVFLSEMVDAVGSGARVMFFGFELLAITAGHRALTARVIIVPVDGYRRRTRLF